MRIFQRNVVYFLLFVFFLLLDGQLSLFLTAMLPVKWQFHSHLLLLMFLFASLDLTELELFIQAFILGVLYDLYYLDTLGVTTLLFPVVILALCSVNDILLYSSWTRMISVFILIFTFEMIMIGIQYLLGISSQTLDSFILYSLVPSLIANLILFVFLQPMCKKINLL